MTDSTESSDWDLVARQFLNTRREAGEDDTTEDWNVLTYWLAEHMVGRDALAAETAALFLEWDGATSLVLVRDDRVVALAIHQGELTTRYFGPPIGGSYVETWRYVNNGWELDLRFEHPSLPGPIVQSARTLRQIETPELTSLRERLAGWATETGTNGN